MSQPSSPISKPPLSLPEFVALFSLTTSLTALSIDAMLPALRDIGIALAVADAKDTQLIVTLFIFGMVRPRIGDELPSSEFEIFTALESYF